MANFTDYLEQLVLEHLLGTSSWTKPTALYVGLFTTVPADDGTGGVEVSGGSYARVQRDPSDSNWTDLGSGGARENAAVITFPTATANWGTVVGFGIWDASSGGNLLLFNTVATSKPVNTGDTASIAAGALDVTQD